MEAPVKVITEGMFLYWLCCGSRGSSLAHHDIGRGETPWVIQVTCETTVLDAMYCMLVVVSIVYN